MSLLRRTVVVSKKGEVHQLAQQVSREVFMADDLAEALDITETTSPDIIVFDDTFSPDHIREFLDKADKNLISAPVLVVGLDENSKELSTEYIRIGAYDYINGTNNYNKLQEIAAQLCKQSQSDDSELNSNDFFIDDFAFSVSIVGRSDAIHKALKMIKLVGASRCNPVLIVGETGTGKELAAKAIHALRHPNKPFVAVNCAALTANLLESELFGHVKGSFTGADRDKIGLVELAGSGTIFLDEISEMPLDLQAKLLRILQEKTFRKVGGTKSITCDATIITTSNRNLKNEVQANRFRRDLYYRLSICPIIIAPLRSPQRAEDIGLLSEHFLRSSTICSEKSKKIACLTKLALEALQKHDWPGNVRELRNVIERAILLETTDKIGLSSIVIEPDLDESSKDCPTCNAKDFSLAKAERELIARALQETGWQKTHAAALLGITRATLYAKVKQYNIGKNSPLDKESNSNLPSKSSSHLVTVS
jgi:DNA-binding NtrC family response regulator